MAELLLTVPEAALRLRLSPLTVQRQLRRGVLRGIKRGKAWRVPESALLESSQAVAPIAPPPADTPAMRAQAILAEMDCGDLKRRNAAIVTLAGADAATSEIVFAAAAQAVADWDGEEEDWSDWRALDSEPFHFPDEDEEETS